MPQNDSAVEEPICLHAFISINRITSSRVQTLHTQGKHQKYERKYVSLHKHCTSFEVMQSVVNIIRSFKGKHSHCGKNKTNRIFLAEDLM